MLCLSIGKFKRLRKLLEIRRAKSKIVGLVRPIRKFIDLKRNLYSLTTIDIIERAATKDMLFRLLAQ